MAADLPLLAICRGAQVLNVAAGGTLVQDIPSAVPSDLPHTIKEPKNAVAHDVSVAPGIAARARARVGRRRVAHVPRQQPAPSVGRRASAPGWWRRPPAPDGVVEAIERADARFCLGVQWHPENFWRTGEFSPLFDAFVRGARRSSQRSRHANPRADCGPRQRVDRRPASNTPRVSTCGVFGNRSKPAATSARSRRPAASRVARHRRRIAGDVDDAAARAASSIAAIAAGEMPGPRRIDDDVRARRFATPAR